MSIKSISFPLFVVALIFIALNFIRPTVLSVVDKRTLKESKAAELRTVEATLASIGTLADSRITLLGEERGSMAVEYLPFESDQDRVLDILNYLSVQAGTSISSVAFKESPAQTRPPIEIPAEITPEMLASGTFPLTPPQAPLPRSFTVTVAMTGTYDGLKSFMEKVTNANRFHTVSMFSITEKGGESPTQEAEAPAVSDGFLDGIFEADFAYLPEEKYENAYLHPVFAAGKFDTAALDKLSAMKSDVPMLVEPSTSGRSNPFIP